MVSRFPPVRALAVPTGRLSRLARFGGLASGIAGGMIADGARQLASGKRPSLSDLLLTPANAVRVTNQLASLRGAAMKLGQMLSMDGGDFLPAELTDILARLRSDARPMPHSQLQAMLDLRWGPGWRGRLARFDLDPLAAASIGQVHFATTLGGQNLAVKVQYPGVRTSIDSDVDNVAGLLRMSGQLPRDLDIAPLLAEAKRQLHEEADYQREARYLARFGELLADAPDYLVPALHAPLTRPNVLAMAHVTGVPIESLADAPQADRDRVVTLLIELLLREMFEFGLMQTDPNFANYQYCPDSRRVILLDFGATREVDPALATGYRGLFAAVLSGDSGAVLVAMRGLRLIGDLPAHHEAAVLAMIETGLAAINTPGNLGAPFDFGDNRVVRTLGEQGLAIATDRAVWHIPPAETLFLQRKFGGIYLLATKLKARVDVRAMIARYCPQ